MSKPAANPGSLHPGTEKRCRARCGCSSSDGFSLSPSVGSSGVGTCGSRAVGQQMEQNFPFKFVFVNESLPTTPAAFTFLQECVFTVLTVLQSITGPQNGQGWKGSLLLQTSAEAALPRITSGWVSNVPEGEAPQPLWAAHSSALSLSKDRSFSLFSDGTSCLSVCACCPLSCC